MTLTERMEKVFKHAQKEGWMKRDEEGKTNPFTKHDARELIDFIDGMVEEEIKKGESFKTSYGIIKPVHRNARMARNPRDPEQEPFEVAAHDTIKIDITNRFHEELNDKGENDKIANDKDDK